MSFYIYGSFNESVRQQKHLILGISVINKLESWLKETDVGDLI